MNNPFRRPRPVPTTRPTHAADRDSGPALVLLPRKAMMPWSVANNAVPITYMLGVAGSVSDLPDPPIFAEVMDADSWSGEPDPLEAQLLMALGLDLLSDAARAEAAKRAKGTAIVGLVAEDDPPPPAARPLPHLPWMRNSLARPHA